MDDHLEDSIAELDRMGRPDDHKVMKGARSDLRIARTRLEGAAEAMAQALGVARTRVP